MKKPNFRNRKGISTNKMLHFPFSQFFFATFITLITITVTVPIFLGIPSIKILQSTDMIFPSYVQCGPDLIFIYKDFVNQKFHIYSTKYKKNYFRFLRLVLF